tara:strand:- start:6792 stop:7598 length:807 start_codon:yes stop_codon:yes gene_type:complete
MNKLTYFLLVLCFTCSSLDDNNDNNVSTFITVTQDLSVVNIDQIISITVTSNETINSIDYSLDGGTTFIGEVSNSTFGNNVKLYLDFDTVGTKNIVFRVKNNEGAIVDKAISVNVERGNAIQIQNLKLNSFYDMGNTWDAEFSDTNPNRLADVYFVILKPPLNIFNGTRGTIPAGSWLWFRSQTRDNESNLNWDLQNEDLYINIEQLTPYIAFIDDDGDPVLAGLGDLMLGPPFERVIPIADYINTKPNTIVAEEPNINLEYELTLDW